MNIGKFLSSVGTSILREVPMGNLVIDIVDAITDDEVPENITGDDMRKRIGRLPPEVQERLLNKTIDSDIKKYETWASLKAKMEQDTPSSRSRSSVVIIFSVLIALITLVFTYVVAQDYLINRQYPSIEVLLIIYGIPSVCLLLSFGVRSDKIIDVILSMYLKRHK